MNHPATYGPHNIGVAAIPSGAEFDMRSLVAAILVTIVADDDLWGQFMDFAEAVEESKQPDPYAVDPLRLEHLLDQLRPVAHVYGAEVGRMAAALADIARTLPMPAPVQERRTA